MITTSQEILGYPSDDDRS